MVGFLGDWLGTELKIVGDVTSLYERLSRSSEERGLRIGGGFGYWDNEGCWFLF